MYGSASNVRNGTGSATLVRSWRLIRMRLSASICPEISRLMSRKRHANTACRSQPPISIPPVPSYVNGSSTSPAKSSSEVSVFTTTNGTSSISVVDPRLLGLGLALRRDVLEREDRCPVGRDRVHLGSGGAESVRVHEVLVLPGAAAPVIPCCVTSRPEIIRTRRSPSSS